jgi:CYTH domain-containing protein
VNGEGDKPWREDGDSTSIRQFYLDKGQLVFSESELIYGGAAIVRLNEEEQVLFQSEKDWAVRVRFRDDRTVFTLKGRRTNASAIELEWPIERALGEALVSLEEYPRVEKTRYEWRGSDGMLWEIDEFEGGLLGLVLAEIELQNIEQPVELPEWAQLEITGNCSWSNSNLAYRSSRIILD